MLKILSSLLIGSVVFILSFVHIDAQINSRYFMDEIWQKNTSNPSHHTMTGDFENDKWVIGLPTYSQSVFHSGPSLENLYRVDNDTTLVITPQKWIDKLNDHNTFRTILDFQTFSLSYRKNDLIFSLGHSMHSNLAISYSKSLMSFIANGNVKLINQSVDLGHKVSGNVYGKWSWGITKKTNKLNFGMRLNILNGIQHLSTPKNDVSLITDEEIYQLKFQMDYELRSAGKFNLESKKLNKDVTKLPVFFTLPSIGESFGSNLGFSLDLGLDWEVNDKLSIEASILDLGQIKWKQNLKNYKLEGEFIYEGIDIFNHNLDDFQISQVKDSLISAFDLKSNSIEVFTTKLPWIISLQADYKLNDKTRVQALYYNQFGDLQYQTIALGINYTLAKGLNVGTNYAINDGRHQLGLNSSWRWKYVQVFAATDNVVGLFNLTHSLNGGGMIGMNVYW